MTWVLSCAACCWAIRYEGLAKELGGYGADQVSSSASILLLKDYTTDAYTKVICDVVDGKEARGHAHRRHQHRP